jgi:hypothetical protein
VLGAGCGFCVNRGAAAEGAGGDGAGGEVGGGGQWEPLRGSGGEVGSTAWGR